MNDPFNPQLLSRLPEPPRKIVLLRASRIGDFLCATPAYRALRKALPEAEITMITLPMLRDLVMRSPHLDRFVAFPGYPGLAEQFFDARRTICFIQEMQAEHFDMAVQMQGTGVYSNSFMLLLGAQTTVGFIRPNDSPGLLDAVLPYPQKGHESEAVLALMSLLGVPAQGTDIEFPLWSSDYESSAELLKEFEPPFIGIHPAARDATRRWAVDRFAAVGIELRRRYGGTVVILGEKEELATGIALSKQVGEPCLNLMGRTTLTILGAVITQLAVFVTNDTGPAHIAYALGTPTVTIFGAATPDRYGPLQNGLYRVLAYPVHCRPCGLAKCPIGYTCLKGVTVTQVMEASEQIIRLESLSDQS